MFKVFTPRVVFQEVPDEVSLAFMVTGCPLRCSGCHSPECWDQNNGQPLSFEDYKDWLQQYQGLITCVLFFGGEWYLSQLCEFLSCARQQGLKTCLYTGLERVPCRLMQQLTYLKTGAWQAELGGLAEPNTNQKFLHLATNNLLNYRFQEQTNVEISQ